MKKLLSILLFAIPLFLNAADWQFRGQLSGWLTGAGDSEQNSHQVGLRYLPETAFSFDISQTVFSEALVAANFYAIATDDLSEEMAKLYRLQWRLAGNQSEFRVGLQKISFGPARLLRSLRWFDQLDPTDPLKMTRGVYAARYLYNFLNNTNIWLWSMYGNSELKGFETSKTANKKPEFGGRFQFPIKNGELALTVHSREAKSSTGNYKENRMAIDGRVDVLAGLWFETVIQESKNDNILYPWQKFLTVGSDITIPVGNGIYFLAEHLFMAASKNWNDSQQKANTSAIMFSYPLGIFDTIQAMQYYSWEFEGFYQYYSWQRTFDNFIFNLSLFHYPSTAGLTTALPMSGYGAQIMFIYNH